MKKQKFYSMVREDGAIIAKLHEGYTDGTYNYYRKGSIWFAIYPANGLSICTGNTRKAAAETAHTPRMAERITAALKWQPEKAEQFAALVEEAEKEAA